MRFKLLTLTPLIIALLPAQAKTLSQDSKPKQPEPLWQAKGELLEACSCSVPCPCNFGQAPSQSYCHTVYAYKLTKARYGKVNLDGLSFGGGEADKAPLGFLDTKATAEQKEALQKLALAVFAKGGPSGGERQFVWAKIETTYSDTKFRVNFADAGGFAATVLIGGDHKSPIIVENNTIWPAKRFIKGKTDTFEYKDKLGNELKFDGVNANLGAFDLVP